MNSQQHLQSARSAATEAARIARVYAANAHVVSSSGKDIKTLADEKMNEVILARLADTNIPVLSEESDHPGALPALCWIVDPLDGTYNFTRQFPFAAVSICLWKDEKPLLGVVKQLFSEEEYWFDEQDAFVSGNKLQVSSTQDLSQAALLTGFPSGAAYDTDSLNRFVTNVQSFKKIRALGAASLMLAYVASGQADAYYEKDIYLWDVAAGLGLVARAGGTYSLKRNASSFKYEVTATNALLADAVASLMTIE